MASHLLLLLLLPLLMVASASAWSTTYRYFGGAFTVCPKGRYADGTFKLELRSKQATYRCYYNPYVCRWGSCGSQLQTTSGKIAWESYRLTWCQMETTVIIQLSDNLPFQIQYPAHLSSSDGRGYWFSNVVSSFLRFSMMAHVDLGIRSDTKDSNRPPVSTMLPIIRVTRNCPRTFNLNMFDPDGDRVKCRPATNQSLAECGNCGLPSGFSLDEDSCTLVYSFGGRVGYHPIELVLEDFPSKQIVLFYTNGFYTLKHPLPAARIKRQAFLTNAFTTATTTSAQTPTTSATTATTFAPTATTFAPTTPTSAPTTTTSAPTTTTSAETTTTSAETTTTSAETTTTSAETTTTSTSITTTSTSTTTTSAPAIPTAAPTTTTSAPIITTPTPPTTTDSPLVTFTNLPPGFAPLQSFLFRPSIRPLSMIPLQFSVLVDSHYAPSCLDGDYFPAFLSPTPANGAFLPATVNLTLEFTVRVKTQSTTIYRLLLTGPTGISQRRLSSGSYTVRWTPTQQDLNCHHTICFVSEAYDRYGRVYHSELRCLTVDVGHYEAVVTCSETTMKVEVEKTYLIRRFEDRLHLNADGGSSCRLKTLSNDTHLVAVMSLASCGTHVEEDDKNIFFRNQITSANTNDVISRRNDVDIAFCCVFPRRANLTLGFTHKNPYAFKEKGFGSFTFQFEFFEGPLFMRQVDGSTYPVEVSLKQMIYMQIEATTSIPNTQLFVESCRATPYDDPNSRISYSIIENGCVKDRTVKIFDGSRTQFRFGMQAFEFIGAHDEVYITCSVLLCDSGAPNTRCLEGCIHADNKRRKREAAAQTSNHAISQGPLHLTRTVDSPVSGWSTNLGMNLVFIIGCLLVSAAVIYRAKRPRAKYMLVPNSEMD